MTLELEAMPVPLVEAEMGTIRVKGSRIPLENIVAAYKRGESAEEIQDNYDTLALADVHTIIAFYLYHKNEVEEYLAEREEVAADVRKRVEERWPTAGLREKLLARWAEREQQNQ